MTSEELLNILAEQTTVNQLWNLTFLFPGQVVFTTSFGMEDQVITDIIFRNDIPIEVVTLDTGRLFKETYSVFNSTYERYNKKITVYFPDYHEVEKMMTEKGPFSFYLSKENRIECCHVRKVAPLQRILEGKKCWISGIRASQSENRSNMGQVEYDAAKSLFKFYPLFNWTFEDVEKYVRENNVPYNILHDKGYVSIGCEPCTRAISEGEDFRSGRWWWETDGKKECGFHVKH
jgi:phosphoadenosine phosphosulfate reductase